MAAYPISHQPITRISAPDLARDLDLTDDEVAAILDIALRGSNGLDFLKELKARGIDLPVLVLSMHDEATYAERALRAGARGYVTKYDASSDVLGAIEQVLKGEIYLSRKMTARMRATKPSGKEPAAKES